MSECCVVLCRDVCCCEGAAVCKRDGNSREVVVSCVIESPPQGGEELQCVRFKGAAYLVLGNNG